MNSVVLFDGDKEFVTCIKNKLKKRKDIKIISITRNILEIEDMLNQKRVNTLLFGPSLKDKDVNSLAESVSNNYPDVGIIIFSKKITTKLLQNAIRSGAKDVLPDDFTQKQLIESLEMANQHSLRVRGAVKENVKNNVTEIETKHSAKIITLFSTKGGVGKTFLATNIAIGLAQNSQKEVVLFDSDLQFGDVAVSLQLKPTHTVYDAVNNINRIDSDLMKGFLTIHSSGLKTLLAPVLPDKADEISDKDIVAIIKTLREMFDFVIIDTPSLIDDRVLAILDNTDEIYLVSSLDIPSLKNTKLTLNMLQLLEYSEQKTKIILNRANSKVKLTYKDVKKTLGTEAILTIPSDINVPRSINMGTPLVTNSPRAVVSKSIFHFINRIKDNVNVASLNA